MPYIPSNRIKTDLYTNGGEFLNIVTNKVHVGYYHATYKGQFFTGKNQNDTVVQELIRIDDGENTIIEYDAENLLYKFVADNVDEDYSPTSYQDRLDYIALANPTPNEAFLLPVQFFPKPTQEEYELGVFQRYFCVKYNENLFVEINKDTYDQISTGNDEWDFKTYYPFRIQWTLTGEKEKVFIANKNSTLLKNQFLFRNFKRNGFPEFLNENYLKFYKSDLED